LLAESPWSEQQSQYGENKKTKIHHNLREGAFGSFVAVIGTREGILISLRISLIVRAFIPKRQNFF
jgi:hypothetical protein